MQNNVNSLVSVVMNCYNSDKFLKEAIESVLNQTYDNLELIFWDNQSTDNSANIIKSYCDSRIKYFYAEKFTPLGMARNLAIEKCSGSWVGFLDCDDIYDKNKILFSINEYNKDKDIALIYSRTQNINEAGHKINRISKCYSGDIHALLILENNFISLSSIIIKRDVLIQVGKIDSQLNYCEDYDLLLKVTKKFSVICVDNYLTYRREHPNNITTLKYKTNITELNEYMLAYLRNNRVSFKIRVILIFRLSYEINVVNIKLLKEFKFEEFSLFFSKHIFYIPFLPFNIIRFISRKL